jgi:DNA-binding IclR family transcriptional regulator
VAKTFEVLLELPRGDAAKSDRQFVTALARGLEILRMFEPGDGPLGNQEIAERCGLPKPTVSRITHTLTKLGYLEYLPRIAKYTLGVGALALGHACLNSIGVRAVAGPHMQELAEYAEASVALGARDRLSMTYLELRRGSTTVALRLDVGARIPIHRSAMGAAYLHALPEKERDFLLGAMRKAEGKEWTATKARLDRAFAQIEARGFCIAEGWFERSINGVGAALALRDSGQIYAFNCSAPTYQFSEGRLVADIGPRLVHMVDAVASDHARRRRTY